MRLFRMNNHVFRSENLEQKTQATVIDPLPQKINLISCEPMVHISDIKLIRTDTTLDLSQKAEKGMLCTM
ncbi:hypothetical protein GYH30_015704 [Glycine max]|uniref:Uncharacterized protein n=1 Tax=Glycine soja TaxID=3848 RepID=A0A445KCJ4_GLYSO|nr:hypothetical protein GYH30_015704 [Glycine max]RZC08450.1 hypothetical protein D0Y65_015251 [Glycine soja]